MAERSDDKQGGNKKFIVKCANLKKRKKMCENSVL